MDCDGFSEIEIGDDFKSRLLGERAQDRGEGFLFVVEGDGSPPTGYPKSEPEQGEESHKGEEELGSIHW